jgi:hypothetical protein
MGVLIYIQVNLCCKPAFSGLYALFNFSCHRLFDLKGLGAGAKHRKTCSNFYTSALEKTLAYKGKSLLSSKYCRDGLEETCLRVPSNLLFRKKG